LKEELECLSRSLGISGRVIFTGFLTQEKLRALYADAHLFLHPSEQGPDGDQEGIPNSMLEAMANGIPVIATRHGGIPEAIEDEVSGLLVAERDHLALAKAMCGLAADAERYFRMSVAAARRARESFDLSTQTRALEAIYSEALRLQR
jgi:glycosyltransferase involved in cell wall biosynthesis